MSTRGKQITKQQALDLASNLNGKRPGGSMVSYDVEATGYGDDGYTIWKVAKYEYKESSMADFIGFVGEELQEVIS